MQCCEEIPSNEPLPKACLRKTAISLLESHVSTLPATLLNALQQFFCTCPQTLHINPSTGWLTSLFCVKPLSAKWLWWSHLMLCLLMPWRPPGNPEISWVHVTRDKWAGTRTACLHNCDFFSVIKWFPNLWGNYTLLTKFRKQITLQSIFYRCSVANFGCD